MSDWRDDERNPPEFEDPEARPRRASSEGVRILRSDEADDVLDTGHASGQPPEDEPRFGDVPRRPEPPPRRAARFSDSDDTWSASSEGLGNEPGRPRRAAAADEGGGGEGSGPVRLPHWTEPPTGEVPRIGPADDAGAPDDDLDAWASVSGSQPRYRVDANDWSEGDFADSDALKDETGSFGALDEQETVDEADDFAERVRARRRGGGGGRGRGGRGRPSRSARTRPRMPLEGDELPPVEAGAEADLTTRVVTGLAIAAAALIMFKLGRGPAAFLVAIIVGLAAFELYESFRRAGYHPATLVGVLGCVAIVFVAYKANKYGLHAFPLVTFLVVVFTMVWYMAEVVKARPIVNIAITLFVFTYIGVFGAFAGLLLAAGSAGTGLVLGMALCAVGYDVGGYFVGSQLGRSRMAPRLSPNKTWEGLFGGMAVALIVGLIVGKVLHPWAPSLSRGFQLGLVVALVAPIGDLCESMIKRDLGVKDLGTILPGHGGVLDRFDAILFCLPATYFLAIHLFR